jgi:hypothetical protein
MPNTKEYAGPTISKKSKDRSWEAYDKWAKNNPKEAEIDLTSAQDDPSFREHAYGKEYVDSVNRQKSKEMSKYNKFPAAAKRKLATKNNKEK